MYLFFPLERCHIDVGAKANRLRRMLSAGFPVPTAYVISEEGYSKASAEELAEDVGELMETVFAGSPVVVRSSSADEDSPLASAAGVYESYLNRRTTDEVLTAIQACRDSADSVDAKAYRSMHGATERAPMNVLIQRMVPCEVSGVLYSRNPIAENATMLVESSKGLGTRVVAGLGAMDRFTLSRSGGAASPAGRRDWAVTEGTLSEVLATLGHSLEAEFGSPQDVEWGLHEGQLYIFQSRDIVVPPVAQPLRMTRPETAGAVAVDEVLSPGYGVGVLTPAGEGPARLGQVVILDGMPTAGELDRLRDASALVVRVGNALSHSAALTRELAIPAVLLADVDTPSSLVGVPVLVDAVAGRLAPLLELPPVERKKAIFAAMRQAGLRGTTGHQYQGRYETVLFDPVFQDRVRAYLSTHDVEIMDRVQSILPFDDPDRSYCGISARIQSSGDACRVQFKRANLLPDRPFRFDEEVHVGVESTDVGAELLRSLHYVDRPVQERRIETAEVNGVRLQFNFWPGANQSYLGLESENAEAVENFLVLCDVPLAEIAPLDGKDLFDMLGLGLDAVHFTQKS
ncbi:PEP/pyruvate-binding domain-containing protein [Streptomyces sp. NPDC057617]|uniref:PEP/pyruvate-binding domain-containing protein n=1 Tax=Streptomyces sp. NPDC057617 TaxID=3346184 RepID=UPI003682923E